MSEVKNIKRNSTRPTQDKEGKRQTLALKRHEEKRNLNPDELWLLQQGLV